MHIINLVSENVKRLKAVNLNFKPGEHLVVVSGKNGQGKSSLLDSIWWALGGSKEITSMPIREGQSEANITLDLGEYVVTRTFTPDHTYLKVESQDGAKYPKPQDLLDKMIGSLSFDPLAFAKEDQKTQRQLLLNLLQIDVTGVDANRKMYHDKRLDFGREIKRLDTLLAGKVEPSPTLPTESINVTDLANELVQARTKNQELAAKHTEGAKLKEAIKDMEGRLAEMKQRFEEIKAEVNGAVLIDTKALEDKMAQAEAINNQIREAQQYRSLKEEMAQVAAAYDECTTNIHSCDEQKDILLASKPMPIPGLSISDEGVTYKNIPFTQISSAEQLKVSLSIAMAMNPKLKVIRIADGSLLDDDNFKVIEEMAKEKDYQVWVEKVDSSGKVGIYIEEGEVKADNRIV